MKRYALAGLIALSSLTVAASAAPSSSAALLGVGDSIMAGLCLSDVPAQHFSYLVGGDTRAMTPPDTLPGRVRRRKISKL